MFNAERVLGSLLSNVTGGKSNALSGVLGGKHSGKAAVGMGLVGLAVAAYEHYNNAQGSSSASPHNQPQSSGQIPPTMKSQSAAPPPPPTSSAAVTAPPPPPPPGIKKQTQQSSLLLIQAMIAAANADGVIDNEEKSNILKNLQQAGSDQEGFDYFQKLLLAPPGLDEIVRQVNNNDLAQQVYMVSLLAIHVDTADEQRYLDDLALGLGLPIDQIQALEQEFKQ